jgi:hypothetical protein
MYPVNIKIKNNALAPNVSDAWVKMIHDDMSSCVRNLKRNHMNAKFKAEKITSKRQSILNFCAAQMIENQVT